MSAASSNCSRIKLPSVRPANVRCKFISTLRKDIFVAAENLFLINAFEHVARIQIIKGHYSQAGPETHVICAHKFN